MVVPTVAVTTDPFGSSQIIFDGGGDHRIITLANCTHPSFHILKLKRLKKLKPIILFSVTGPFEQG